MVLPGRHGDVPLIAEDARVLGFEGVPAQAQWLDDATAMELLGARPDENTALELGRQNIKQILAGLDAALPEVSRRGEEFAAELREAHRRVRRAAEQAVRGLRVTVAGDADILGCYVYLPYSGEDAWDSDDLWDAADAEAGR
jgi:hypothetical protein